MNKLLNCLKKILKAGFQRKEFFLCYHIHTDTGTHPASYQVCRGRSLSGCPAVWLSDWPFT